MASKPTRYSARKTLTASELKTFRSHVAQLKREGIITAKVDARSARPYFIRGGDSLAVQVNRGLKELSERKQALSIVPHLPKPLLLNHPISFRKLPHSTRSLAKTMRDIETNYKELNKLKRPGEKFVFKVLGVNSYAPYTDIRLLAQELGESEGIQELFRKHGASIYDSIELMRWNKTATRWREVSELNNERIRANKKGKNIKQAKRRR